MADVFNYIVPTGVVLVDTTVISEEVITEYKNVFGTDLIITPETPQGALIVAETLARVAVADNNATLANQINPNLAGGVFLDAILALTGVQRTPASSSTASCTITGVVGTLIPAGSQARSGDNIFETIEDVTIPTGGILTGVIFASIVPGPISALANTLNQIVSNILGWETVTNPADAVLGEATQSDVAARFFRRQTLFAQGVSTAGAIIAAVRQVEGITSESFRENVANTTQVIDGVTMVAHSIYVCVAGTNFSNQQVAEAILSRKSAGANFNNGASGQPQSVDVIDLYSDQLIQVLFDIADDVPIEIQVTVSVNTSVNDPEQTVKDAIVNYAEGNIDGENGLQIGTAVSSFELAGAINIASPGIFVHNLEIKKVSGGSFSTTEIPIEIFEIATIDPTNIAVTVV